MALTITIQSYHKDIAELRTMLTDYTLDGGTVLRGPGNDRILPLDADGESALTQAQYDTLCLDPVIRFDGGTFYVIVPDALLLDPVPTAFQDSAVYSEDGVSAQVPWGEYVARMWSLGDGTTILRCLHMTQGATTSPNGLTDSERVLWTSEFGQLLVMSTGSDAIAAIV